ncbi:hypothetical protein CAPTEDRAFT_207534 [Capitella teleta]|uniref:Apple domain-containing protein n=1 Tax=Capitella teleta TaxID=283909 RepID=R7V7I2_CAPTE|nr:hypothetical protein CAPTEDRAFT_207534 [Capitella teleta]|eukprot:ELU14437.1 hypothetical protein CAPTEDRAFT_207534 [Capitella teleta]
MALGRCRCLLLLLSALLISEGMFMPRDEVMGIIEGKAFALDHPPRWTAKADGIHSCSVLCVSTSCCLAAFFDTQRSTCDLYDIKVAGLQVDMNGSIFIARQWDQEYKRTVYRVL